MKLLSIRLTESFGQRLYYECFIIREGGWLGWVWNPVEKCKTAFVVRLVRQGILPVLSQCSQELQRLIFLWRESL